MALKKDILWRVGIVYISVVILSIAVIARIVYLKIAEGDELRAKAEAISQRDIIVLPNRGDIVACDGRLLASSVPYYDLNADLSKEVVNDTTFNNNIVELARGLSNLVGPKSVAEWKAELVKARNDDKHYHLIKRKVSYLEMQKIKELPIFNLGRYTGGLIVEQLNRRAKPFDKLAARTIGYLGEDNYGEILGKVGLEGAYEKELKGVEGMRLLQKLPGGGWMPVNDEGEIEAEDGKDVITTIDVNIQDVATTALYDQLTKQNAHHGCVILMEVHTGDIKAIANLERNSIGDYNEYYNYAIGESTEPGSVFKLAVYMSAIEDGYITVYDSVDTSPGWAKFYDRIMWDSNHKGYGKITIKDAFAFSSNVAASRTIVGCYSSNPQRLIDRLYSMNLHERLGIEITGEGDPYIKDTRNDNWWGTTLPWMAIGYESKLTPLQILTFYNAVANNGKMVKPRFVKALRYRGEIVKTFNTEVINPMICSKETIKQAKEMLEAVVEYGSGKNLKNENYSIAGKTGTAQIANKDYGYSMDGEKSYQASFVGYFPADNPTYSCIVIVNAPSNGVYYGNVVAGGIFKEISDKLYATSTELQQDIDQLSFDNVLSVPYSKNGYKNHLMKLFDEFNLHIDAKDIKSIWINTTTTDSVITVSNRFIVEKKIPNVKGMGARDALYLLENMGLAVKLVGRGSVKKQSLNPGEAVIKGSEIIIELS